MNAIEIAIKMETDAIKFYKEASEKTKNPVGKKMFLTIREDEKRHLNMLTQIFKGLDIKVGDVSPTGNVKIVFESMKNEMMKKVEAMDNELEAFRIASQMEKEGIEFYKKALSEAKTEKEKALFDRLIKEEERHYRIFANSYSFLSDTGNWFMWEEHSIVEG
ncbi:MAG: ferritin family protein [Nitrospirae bacterium]|nr:ferritin family protein [Nitrospirota bacterium]MBI3378970.1 ferritin family protein [Nitrospirota bacterium]